VGGFFRHSPITQMLSQLDRNSRHRLVVQVCSAHRRCIVTSIDDLNGYMSLPAMTLNLFSEQCPSINALS
jgi:hypothetical protein